MAPFSFPTPVVSVIVPVYNAEPWLAELVGALRQQTFTHWECLLVDDGSTDSSARICLESADADSRFRVLSQPNAGVSVARNLGIAEARGEWLYFIDADDLPARNALERLMETAERTDADIVTGGWTHCADDLDNGDLHASPELFESQKIITRSLYQHPDLASVWGTLFSRRVFHPEGPRFTPGIRFEDLDFTYRAFERASRVALLSDRLYFYRPNSSSFINTMTPSRLDILDVTDRIAWYYKGTPVEKAARSRRFSAYFGVLMLLMRTGYDAPAALQRCLAVIRQGRREALTDPRVRFKNKTGALVSYLGSPVLRLLAKFYKS